MAQCSKCGATATLKSGVNKKGKPYKGYFCGDEECRNVDWVQTKSPQAIPPPATKPEPRLELLLKAADITIAQLKDDKDISVLSALEMNFRHLQEVYKGTPTPKPEPAQDLGWEDEEQT